LGLKGLVVVVIVVLYLKAGLCDNSDVKNAFLCGFSHKNASSIKNVIGV
jgi:hypothetical protein